ncbi:MAG: 4Fe-4S binding protein [Bacteroidota bacterium]|nr:4Fe-4S binding protein [Bacteroidota bacterium]
MKKSVVRILQIVILIGIVWVLSWRGNPHGNLKSIEEAGHSVEFLHTYFEGKLSVIPDTAENICSIYNREGQSGFVLFSTDLTEQTRGYAGVIDFALILSNDYTVLGVEVLNHQETPSYMNWIARDGFYEQFIGKSVGQIMEETPDMISGATMSCNAISTDMKSMLSEIASYQESSRKFETVWLLKNLAALLFLVFALLHFFYPKYLRKTRIILLILSVGVLGFWCGYFLSLSIFHSWILNGIMLKMQVALFAMLVFSVSLPLFTQRSFYCSYVCPFGAMQELAGKINPKHKFSIPKAVKPIFQWMRFAILLVVIVLLLIGLGVPLGDMEPFSMFQIRAASLFVLILAAFMIVLSVFISKPWCRYFCPTGMILTLLRKPIFSNAKKKPKHESNP